MAICVVSDVRPLGQKKQTAYVSNTLKGIRTLRVWTVSLPRISPFSNGLWILNFPTRC